MHTPLIDVPGGILQMGSGDHYPEEAPVTAVQVAAFRLERHPVTNAQFAAFVTATGHQTHAEKPVDGPVYAELSDAERLPGSLVFTGTRGTVDLTDWRQWWTWVPGAQWRMPQGPDARTRAKADHPVVQVSRHDALAYCAWADRRLPTEAEHEWAAAAGVLSTPYAWGAEATPDETLMANTWQGEFPYRNRGARGFKGTSPVGRFPANSFGLHDMIGNVWEWTDTRWTADHTGQDAAGPSVASPCCGGASPEPGQQQWVVKGGSHLCAPEYCLRYRPAARTPQTGESATTHLGFRCSADA